MPPVVTQRPPNNPAVQGSEQDNVPAELANPAAVINPSISQTLRTRVNAARARLVANLPSRPGSVELREVAGCAAFGIGTIGYCEALGELLSSAVEGTPLRSSEQHRIYATLAVGGGIALATMAAATLHYRRLAQVANAPARLAPTAPPTPCGNGPDDIV